LPEKTVSRADLLGTHVHDALSFTGQLLLAPRASQTLAWLRHRAPGKAVFALSKD